jgi:proteic killer suppression protein
VIVSWKGKGTEDVFDGIESKDAKGCLPRELWRKAKLKLDSLNAANDVMDLKAVPGNHLEKLLGKLKGYYSVRINDQYRIVFTFANGQASEVHVTDYH